MDTKLVETPSPKEAFVGFFQDLWKEMSKRNPIDESPVTEEEKSLAFEKAAKVLGDVMFTTGGITKIAGLQGLTKGLFGPVMRDILTGKRSTKELTGLTEMMKEAVKLPESIYRDVDKLLFRKDLGSVVSSTARAAYLPGENAVVMAVERARPGTQTHEFTHVRQYNPKTMTQGFEVDPLFKNRERIRSFPLSKKQQYRLDPLELQAKHMANSRESADAFEEMFDFYTDVTEKQSEKVLDYLHEKMP